MHLVQRRFLRLLPVLPASLLTLPLLACPGLEPSVDDGEPASTSQGDGPGSSTEDTGLEPDGSSDGADSTGTPPGDDAAHAFLQALPGLWVAPVTSMTSVGDFPIMAMDIRPADDRTLFSRVDLDADNNLRFAFALEDHDGEPTLVFRNGGYFLGFLRDTRTTLQEHDPQAGTWRFCAVTGGCDYVDASFTLETPERLVLTATVLGRPHMHWEGMLVEARTLDGDFPYDPTPGADDDPFPAMPTLRVTVSWTTPTTEPVDAWVVLSTTDCSLVPGSCQPSRFIRGTAPVGATSVDLVMDQIHAGSYQANAFLDHNGNLAGTLAPDSGDLVSVPNHDVEVAPAGESTASIPLLVEL
ncbi:hypothetical protein [Paraliomyxa miuraensis]|uniref:hypothetical protein n=1 Tax=Paraliomyxa miuraensis TaxID=376150 RepID=UPI0022513749|nr:hypothetical protein [Paraliomyxa miuraensis]MCX4245888.1 hypothetical protein [Paraliomyxa miuraensis]